jgi:multiple sugar transport system substrate-binding protein
MEPIEAQRRLAVARASDELWHGEMTRAEFLRVCARAGLAVAGLALTRPRRAAAATPPTAEQILATAGPNSAIEPSSDQHRFLKDVGRTFAGRTVRVVTEDTPPSVATREIMRQEFLPITGIDVVWELQPLHRILAMISADTAMKAGATDVFYLDQAWVGRFVDDTVPVKDLLAKRDLAYPAYDFDDILPPLVEQLASYKGRVAGIPYDIPIHVVLYRRDIFDRLGLEPPRTVPEYLSVVQTIHREMQPHVYGTTAMWKAGHYSHLIDACTWLWSHGGSFFGPNGEPAINDEQAVAGMEFMLELGKYVPPEAITWDWTGETLSFAQGRAGLYINAGEWFSVFDDPAQSKVVGLVEAAPCPAELALRPKSACSFDETPGFSRQGGSYLGLSKYGRNPDASWILLQWATSADTTTRASLLGGSASPVRRSNFDDPRIKARATVGVGTTRHFAVTLDAINNRMGTEPRLPAWPSLAVDQFAVELGRMTTGQQDVRTTLDNMAAQARQAVMLDASRAE